MKNYFYHLCLVVAIIATCSSCNDKFEDEYLLDSTPVVDETLDLLHSKLIYELDLSESATHIVPLNTDISPYDLEVRSGDSNLDIEFGTSDGAYCINIDASNVEFESGRIFKVVPVQVISNLDKTKSRTAIVILKRDATELSANSRTDSSLTVDISSDLSLVYSGFIGKGTMRDLTLGNSVMEVIKYDELRELDQVEKKGYLDYTTGEGGKDFDVEADGFVEATTAWSINVGASAKVPVGKTNKVLSGSFSYGYSSEVTASLGYEYYLNYYREAKSEIALKTSLLFTLVADTIPSADLLYITKSSILDHLNTKSFDTSTFFKNWGTDVITQGVFGGSYLTVFGRSQNSYSESVSHDYELYGKGSNKVDTSIFAQWLSIFQAKNASYVDGSVDGSAYDSEYSEASKSFLYTQYTGGYSGLTAESWIEGFNESESTYTLISYRRKSDIETEEETYMLDIEEYLTKYIESYEYYAKQAAIENGLESLSDADTALIELVKTNIDNLSADKADFLEGRMASVEERQQLVVADFQMITDENGHGHYFSYFVAESPKDNNVNLIYFPLRANEYAPIDNEYPLETSQGEYIGGGDSKDHYWYYAMGMVGEVTPIIDIKFSDDDESGYYKRGHSAGNGMPIMIDERYVQVKYGDADDSASYITAIGIHSDESGEACKVIATTAGAQLERNPTDSQKSSFMEFWNESDSQNTRSTAIFYKGNSGAGSDRKDLSLIYSRKELDFVNNENTIHPYAW